MSLGGKPLTGTRSVFSLVRCTGGWRFGVLQVTRARPAGNPVCRECGVTFNFTINFIILCSISHRLVDLGSRFKQEVLPRAGAEPKAACRVRTPVVYILLSMVWIEGCMHNRFGAPPRTLRFATGRWWRCLKQLARWLKAQRLAFGGARDI